MSATSSELRLLLSSLSEMRECAFGGDKVSEFTVSVISPDESV